MSDRIIKQTKGKSSTGKKGGRKIGRNQKKCEKYRLGNQRAKNKKREAEKRARKFTKREAKREKK